MWKLSKNMETIWTLVPGALVIFSSYTWESLSEGTNGGMIYAVSHVEGTVLWWAVESVLMVTGRTWEAWPHCHHRQEAESSYWTYNLTRTLKCQPAVTHFHWLLFYDITSTTSENSTIKLEPNVQVHEPGIEKNYVQTMAVADAAIPN